MKKVIRLTESDLVKIIKKVLTEDSGPIETGGAPGKLSVKNGNLVFHNKNGQSCQYQVYNKGNGDLQRFEWMKFNPGMMVDTYEVYFKNKTGDHQNSIPKSLVNGLLSPGFECKENFDATLLGFGGVLKKVA